VTVRHTMDVKSSCGDLEVSSVHAIVQSDSATDSMPPAKVNAKKEAGKARKDDKKVSSTTRSFAL
jgi:hypothetical protein